MSSFWGLALPMVLAVASGAGIVVQQALNADLRVSLGSGAWAGLVSYLCGTVCMVLLILFLREGVPSAASLARVHWFSWMGGVFGAAFIAIALFFIQRLGAATFIALLIAGQLICSLLLDHYGVLGLEQHSASPMRLMGAALLMAGVVFIRM
jgi:transporter family-2 protein